MNDAKQSFEVWAAPRSLGGIERMRYGSVWEQAYEAGEIAMKEKAAKLCDSLELPDERFIGNEIRALPLSGAEESKK